MPRRYVCVFREAKAKLHPYLVYEVLFVEIHKITRIPRALAQQKKTSLEPSQYASHHQCCKKYRIESSITPGMNGRNEPIPTPANIFFCPEDPGAVARACHIAYDPTPERVPVPIMRQDKQSLCCV
jgi:hypothetical protein